VYARLRAQATLNRRSLTSEAIVCLETMLNLRPADTRERLVRLRALRAALGEARFGIGDINGFKHEGRE